MSKATSSLSYRALTKRNLALALGMLVATGLLSHKAYSDDIVTLDKKKYEKVTNVTNTVDAVFFSHQTSAGVFRARVLFKNLPDELKEKYHYDPFEEGILIARRNQPVVLGLNSAFRLANLEAAKKKAAAEKKLIGFIMVWDSLFGKGEPMGGGSRDGLAGFYTIFNKGMVLVFVRHEDELNKVPPAVQKGFFGPDEGGFAPNMAVVTEDCSTFVCEIPLGGKDSDGRIREEVFRPKIAVIKTFVADRKSANKSAPAPPAEAPKP